MEYGHNRYIVQINFITTFVSQKVRANERGEEKAKRPTFFFFLSFFFFKKNVIYTTFLQQILSDRLLLSMLLDTHFMVAFAFSFFFFFLTNASCTVHEI